MFTTRVVGRLVAACAVWPAVFLSAAVAHAQPDPAAPAADPKGQCESPEVGGIFTSGTDNGISRSVCQYIVQGYAYYDSYENGAYVGTTVFRDGAQVPTEKPVIPPLFNVPGGFSLVPF